MTTQIVGHGRFLFVSLPQGGADAELAAAIDALGSGLENMHEVEGNPSRRRSSGAAFSCYGPSLGSVRSATCGILHCRRRAASSVSKPPRPNHFWHMRGGCGL